MAKNADEKRGIERFRRIKEEHIEVDPRVQDNSFEAKVSVCLYEIFSGFFLTEHMKRKRKDRIRTHKMKHLLKLGIADTLKTRNVVCLDHFLSFKSNLIQLRC